MDTANSRVTSYVAVNSTWNVEYYYTLDIRGTLYGGGQFQSCHIAVNNQPTVGCTINVVMNSGFEYVSQGYHSVYARYNTAQAYNAPPGSYCLVLLGRCVRP
jgi:hypothetical protein